MILGMCGRVRAEKAMKNRIPVRFLELSPSAEFNRTMLAEEFRQSQSCESNYTSDFSLEEVEEDED